MVTAGGNLIGSDGSKIGSIGHIYADDETSEPTWVTVKTGLFGTNDLTGVDPTVAGEEQASLDVPPNYDDRVEHQHSEPTGAFAGTGPAGGGASGVRAVRGKTGPVVVGIVPGQPLAVLHAAVDVAEAFGVKLICVYVDITSYLAEDPEEDAPADDAEAISAGLREHLAANLKNAGIRWSFLTLTGNPAQAIGRLAESAGASTIVVGSRARRLGVRLEHLLVGSVAVELTQRQHRPVLIIPLPRSPGNRPHT